jgi:MFS family permease
MVALLLCGLWAGPRMGEMSAADASPRTESGTPARGRARPSRAVVVIGALVFALFMSEGALTDWSALYLDRDLGAGASLAAIGYGAFAGGMAVGRAFGDALKRAFGGVRLLRGGALLTCLSIAAMLLIGLPGVALVALLLAGLGAANGVPLLFSAAGHARGMDAGPAIATVSSAGYFGLLAGPPLLGFVADATSLPLALAIVALLTAVVALSAGRAQA